MRIEFDAGNLHLSLGQTLKIQGGIGSTVCCRQGTLWLTEENRARDVVLGPGSCHVLSQQGITLIQALGEAVVALA